MSGLAALTWPRVPSRPVVVVPLGSTEQHGPHLPFDTDTVIADAVAAGLARALNDDAGTVRAVRAPALGYGASGEHQAFPGTVSIGHDALARVVVELVRSLSTWAGEVVVVNGHGGNLEGLTRAVVQLRAEGHPVAWLPCSAGHLDAHAGHSETSLMLHLAPERVDVAAIAAGNTEPIADLLPRLRVAGVDAVAPSGVLGDPTRATAADGAVLLAGLVADARERVAAGAPDRLGCLRQPAGAARGGHR